MTWNKEDLPTLTFELCHPDAKIPAPGNELASGLDLYTPEDLFVPAREIKEASHPDDLTAGEIYPGKANVKIGVKVQFPAGYDAKIESRSGTSWKSCIEVGAGRIDNDYRDEIGNRSFTAEILPSTISNSGLSSTAVIVLLSVTI